jgi:hypothetical protein
MTPSSVPPLAYALSAFRPVVVDDLIRLGRDQDGGYVVSARAVDAADVLVGLGISEEWSFETAFAARRPHASVYAVDGTVSADVFEQRRTTHVLQAMWSAVRLRRWLTLHHVESARGCARMLRDFRRVFEQPRCHFITAMIREPGRPGMTWAELIARIAAETGTESSRNLFVKMDVEGAEYRVLPTMLADAARITGIAVEFHDADLLWERLHEQVQLLFRHFVVVHVHGNNYMPPTAGSTLPRSLEVSFLNRSLITARELDAVNDRTYPLEGLDHPNCASLPDLALDFALPSS